MDLNGLGMPLAPSSSLSLTGNAGTNPVTDYVGTSDNQPLNLDVSGARALQLQPNATSPNLIGGSSVNAVTVGKVGAVIAGGGLTGTGNANSVTGDFGTVSGGRGSSAGRFATVAGGVMNTAASLYSTAAGTGNTASGTASTTLGSSNTAGLYATALGGWQHGHRHGRDRSWRHRHRKRQPLGDVHRLHADHLQRLGVFE